MQDSERHTFKDNKMHTAHAASVRKKENKTKRASVITFSDYSNFLDFICYPNFAPSLDSISNWVKFWTM
jgi:hypothetical protein